MEPDSVLHRILTILAVLALLLYASPLAGLSFRSAETTVGASPGQVLWLFGLKATMLGLLGGIAGFVAGMAISIPANAAIDGLAVAPSAGLLLCSLGLGMLLSGTAAAVPVWSTTRLDPIVALQEA